MGKLSCYKVKLLGNEATLSNFRRMGKIVAGEKIGSSLLFQSTVKIPPSKKKFWHPPFPNHRPTRISTQKSNFGFGHSRFWPVLSELDRRDNEMKDWPVLHPILFFFLQEHVSKKDSTPLCWSNCLNLSWSFNSFLNLSYKAQLRFIFCCRLD